MSFLWEASMFPQSIGEAVSSNSGVCSPTAHPSIRPPSAWSLLGLVLATQSLPLLGPHSVWREVDV